MSKAARILAPLAALALAATAACSPASDDADDNGGDNGGLVLPTGSTGGTYYPLGNAIASVWNEHLDVTVNPQSSDASAENLRLLDSGRAQIIMSVNGTAVQAYEGTGAFAGDDGLENDFVAVGNIYAEVLQVVATANSGIEDITDLDGKRVAIGPPGSATAIMADNILDSYDIDVTTFEDGFGDAADKLRDGQIDASFALLALPATSIDEVAQNTDINLVNFTDEGIDELIANDPSLTTMEIPGGTYDGIDDDVLTVTNWATFYVAPGMDDELVYDLTRVLYDHADEVQHGVAAEIQLETALDGLGGIPLHPGAQRYYEEQGVEIPA
ncbi:TAXI family TRAP transporter solute-binding subunit [Natronoglycomyces albus]|uniref:TAXI family TRAP transporter solute-binding subunit n=1 Tax=Natronoglycomyces albus TaxID=2811108 RepID=A0A895XRN8_9ACTN|nr:TAXI family TRAP transporter solute-binding subunit [Natronoglycomyces albus]QSB04278.1 TAXI family TRAP transporter solute-binding subunit [Natronoglycomyces albus]